MKELDKNKNLELTIITALAAAQVLHETLDELEETSFYRQSLKAATNRLQLELTKTCDTQIAKLWEMDETTMTQIQNGIIETSKLLAKANPVIIATLGNLLSEGVEINKITKE